MIGNFLNSCALATDELNDLVIWEIVLVTRKLKIKVQASLHCAESNTPSWPGYLSVPSLATTDYGP